MKRKGIKDLIVDLGGILIGLDRQRRLENFKKLGLPNVGHALDIYHQQDFFQHYRKGLVSNADFRSVTRGKIGKDIADVRTGTAWNSFLVNIPTCRLDLLLVLHKGYAVYLLGNTNEIYRKWSCEHAFPYKTFHVEDYFGHIFLSYEMKTVKPDEKIFQRVLNEAGLGPKETFFIDDSKVNYIMVRSLGISTYIPKAGEDWSHLFK